MTFLPCILDKTWYFLEHLDNHARTGDVFKLDELCINLTFDIIGTFYPSFFMNHFLSLPAPRRRN